jgi:hypothetical protein
MPTPTYTLIDSVTLASSAASVTFSSIDQTYGDLILIATSISTANAGTRMRLNSDSSTIYSRVYMNGSGTSATSSASSGNNVFYGGGASSSPSLEVHQLMDYSATDKHTSILTRYDIPGSLTRAGAHRYASTSAITAIEFYGTANFDAGSTYFLYGIAKAL